MSCAACSEIPAQPELIRLGQHFSDMAGEDIYFHAASFCHARDTAVMHDHRFSWALLAQKDVGWRWPKRR
jgi:hypothetical protein